MKLSDIIKKGNGIPAPTDLIVGGIGIDVDTGLIYSKKSDDTIFYVGNGIKDIITSGGTIPGEDTIVTISYEDTTKANSVFTVKAGVQGNIRPSSYTLVGSTLSIVD